MLVIGKKVTKAGKAQHLKVGKSYDISEEHAKFMIANGQAEYPKKAKANIEPPKKVAKAKTKKK